MSALDNVIAAGTPFLKAAPSYQNVSRPDNPTRRQYTERYVEPGMVVKTVTGQYLKAVGLYKPQGSDEYSVKLQADRSAPQASAVMVPVRDVESLADPIQDVWLGLLRGEFLIDGMSIRIKATRCDERHSISHLSLMYMNGEEQIGDVVDEQIDEFLG